MGIEEGLNVMEASNGAGAVIAYGKGGEIASNRRDEQEMFVLCLRILQSALVFANTLMLLQEILGEPEWADPAVLVARTPVRLGEPRHAGPPARGDLATTMPGPCAPADERQPAPYQTVESAVARRQFHWLRAIRQVPGAWVPGPGSRDRLRWSDA